MTVSTPPLYGRVATLLRMIRFSHTVFAMPFALAGAWLAARGVPELAKLLWILLAMVAARSAAMSFNRIIDRNFDAQNPRTASRELVTGRVSVGAASVFTIACGALFLFAAAQLGPWCLRLGPLVLAILFGYSYLKRFTWLCHVGLGLALGLAPAGAWLAIRGEFSTGWLDPVLLGVAVLFWVTGFDLLYALQDAEFDRRAGLHSLPAQFGTRAAQVASALLHACAVGTLFLVEGRLGLGLFHRLAILIVAGILLTEQVLVRLGGLAQVPRAFFTVNAWVGPVYFAGLWLGLARGSA